MFVSACMDILSEQQSQGGRTGSEAQRQLSSGCDSLDRLRSRCDSKCFYSFDILMPEVNSKVATINAERYWTNCCRVGANTSGGDVSQWGVFILHVDNNGEEAGNNN